MANNILGNYNPLLSLFGNNNQLLSGLLGSSPIVPLIRSSNSSPSAGTDPNVVLISGLGQLLSSLNIFQDSLQQIYSPYAVNNSISGSSSNPSVASVSTAAGAQNGNYSVSVSQLAQAHSAVTAFTLPDTSSTAVGSGSLTIKTGSYAYTSSTSASSFTPSGSSATLSISNGTLSSIATAINGSGVGMVANIVQNASGNYQLQISAAQTGASNNFQILVSDNDGNNTDQNGLSRLAFDQTQAVGSGQNLTQTQAAQNANYLINGASGSNAGNSGISLGASVSMDLLSTGSTNISVKLDLNGLNGQAQSLADAFNTLQGSLNALLVSGGLLSRDPIAKQLANSMNQQAGASYSNGSSLLVKLNQIGLNFQYPQQFGQMGSLSLSNNSLQSAYSDDSQGVANLLYTAARALNWLANSYASYGNGTIPQTLTALQKMQFSQQLRQSATPTSNTVPANLASLTGNQSGTIQLSAQQISALSLYAMVYSLGAPYAVNSQILNNGLGLSGNGNSGNGISTYA